MKYLKSFFWLCLCILGFTITAPISFAGERSVAHSVSVKKKKNAAQKRQIYRQSKAFKSKKNQSVIQRFTSADLIGPAATKKRSSSGYLAAHSAANSHGHAAGWHRFSDPLALQSSVVHVEDIDTKEILFSKNSNAVLPIASITKLMTALVIIEAHQDLNEILVISEEDVDTEKHSSSRLRVGYTLSRRDAMHLALMASENRAAHALGRYYPGGIRNFVAAMNTKARNLGMFDSRFVDPTGLNSSNVSSGPDLARLLKAAQEKSLIRELSTSTEHQVFFNGRPLQFRNTNALVKSNHWDINVSKTGFIQEAGRCLVMQARIEGRRVAIVLLDSVGKAARLADANRIKRWLETH